MSENYFSNAEMMNYKLHIRDNFRVEKPANGKRVKASWLFNNLMINECAFHRKIVSFKGAGIHLGTLNPVKTKKHGRRANNLYKYGLTYIASLLFSGDIDNSNQCCKFLPYT